MRKIKSIKFRFYQVVIPALILAIASTYLPSVLKISRALGGVYATVETVPVTHPPDSADDIAIWIHPTDPAQSTIIGTDKPGALEVYDLTGARLQSIPIMTNNVDLRYNFNLSGQPTTLVTGIDRTNKKLFIYKVNPETRMLEDVSLKTGMTGLQGSAMYISPTTGKYYVFTSLNGVLKQYELTDNGAGKVAATLVRTVNFASNVGLTEGIVADDIYAKVYVSEEGYALWQLGAEPIDGEAKVMIDQPVANGGHFVPDLEGLAIYYKSDGTGYLIASSQGNATYVVYQRETPNAYLGTFEILDGIFDRTSGTDGIDVTNYPLGPAFPYGVFIAQDGINKDGATTVNQNFKLVPFESISNQLGLSMDTTWDPRLVGSSNLPSPSPSPSVSPSPSLTPSPTASASPTPTPSSSPQPSSTPAPSPSTLIFYPTDDTYTNSNSATKNFGKVTTLQGDSTPVKHVYLKFNLTGLDGKQITDAKLRLYVTEPSNMGGNLRMLTDLNWTELTVTANNAPAASSTIISSLMTANLNTWYDFALGTSITGNGIYGFRLDSTSPNGNGVSYSSKEGSIASRPQLVLQVQ